MESSETNSSSCLNPDHSTYFIHVSPLSGPNARVAMNHGCIGQDRRRSHSELLEMVVEMTPRQPSPERTRHLTENRMWRPPAIAGVGRESFEQIAQCGDVALPLGWHGRKRPGWALDPALGPRHHIDDELLHRRVAQRTRTGHRPRRDLAERDAQLIGEMTDHLPRV